MVGKSVLGLFAMAAIMLLAGCIQVQQKNGRASSSAESTISGEARELNGVQKVFFTTEDGFRIAGDLYEPRQPNGRAIVLLHIFNKSKETWREFALGLQQRGWTALAIDLRGHGESTEQNGGRRVVQEFSEKDFQSMVLDAKAAKKLLEEKEAENKINVEKIFVAGASIGANTALNYCVGDPSLAGVVLLSPGLNYKGISTEESTGECKTPVFLAASGEDEYSFQSSQAIFEKLGDKRDSVFEQLQDAGHGTTMLAARPSLAKKIVEWMESQ